MDEKTTDEVIGKIMDGLVKLTKEVVTLSSAIIEITDRMKKQQGRIDEIERKLKEAGGEDAGN